jgi:hypothetical protein
MNPDFEMEDFELEDGLVVKVKVKYDWVIRVDLRGVYPRSLLDDEQVREAVRAARGPRSVPGMRKLLRAIRGSPHVVLTDDPGTCQDPDKREEIVQNVLRWIRGEV